MAETLPTLDSWRCFACGPNHPKGLRLRFEADGDRVRTRFRLDDDYTGTGPVVHGGIVATVFDETMAWCLLRFQKRLYFTTKLETRYRRPIRANTDLAAEAWIARVRGRGLAEVKARIVESGDPETALAQAEAVFIEAPIDVMDELPGGLRDEMQQVLSTFD